MVTDEVTVIAEEMLLVREDGAVRQYPLRRGTAYRLGRGRDCDIAIDRPFVSRQQAELVADDSGWLIRQIGRTNPTLSAGRPISVSRMAPGDRFEIHGPNQEIVTIELGGLRQVGAGTPRSDARRPLDDASDAADPRGPSPDDRGERPAKFWSRCGHKVTETDSFCSECGAPQANLGVVATGASSGASPTSDSLISHPLELAAAELASAIAPPPANRRPPTLALYRSAGGRSTWVETIFGILIAISALYVFMLALEVNAVNDVLDGRLRAAALDRRAGTTDLASWIYILASISAALSYFMWLHRAHSNLRALAPRGLQYSPASAIWWNFVPFAAMWKPYQAVSEIWKASQSGTWRWEDAEWKHLGTPALLRVWWGCWLVSGFLSNFVLRSDLESGFGMPEDLELWAARDYFDMAATIAGALAAVLVILIVRRITTAQEQRYIELSALPQQ